MTLRAHGRRVEKPAKITLPPGWVQNGQGDYRGPCPRCHGAPAPTNRYCSVCGGSGYLLLRGSDFSTEELQTIIGDPAKAAPQGVIKSERVIHTARKKTAKHYEMAIWDEEATSKPTAKREGNKSGGIHEPYQTAGELKAWDCKCEGKGTCGACLIRACVRKHYGTTGVSLITGRMVAALRIANKISVTTVRLPKDDDPEDHLFILRAPHEMIGAEVRNIKSALETVGHQLVGKGKIPPQIILLERGMSLTEIDDDALEKIGLCRIRTGGRTLEEMRKKYQIKEATKEKEDG